MVTDTGQGISKEKIKFIFNLFQHNPNQPLDFNSRQNKGKLQVLVFSGRIGPVDLSRDLQEAGDNHPLQEHLGSGHGVLLRHRAQGGSGVHLSQGTAEEHAWRRVRAQPLRIRNF